MSKIGRPLLQHASVAAASAAAAVAADLSIHGFITRAR